MAVSNINVFSPTRGRKNINADDVHTRVHHWYYKMADLTLLMKKATILVA